MEAKMRVLVGKSKTWIGIKKKKDFIVPLTARETNELMECCIWMLAEINKNENQQPFTILEVSLLLHNNFPDVPSEHCLAIWMSLIQQGCIVKNKYFSWIRLGWGDLEMEKRIEKDHEKQRKQDMEAENVRQKKKFGE
jgi:hypothetical protein